MAPEKTKKVVLQSSFGEMEKLERFVAELQNWAAFDDEQRNRILLPLSEAVNNAIIHGNKQDPDKQVTVVARLQNQRLTISVKDEGAGFDPETLPDPLKEENLLNQGGRGVYLIKQYADEVTFSDQGSRISFRFMLDQ